VCVCGGGVRSNSSYRGGCRGLHCIPAEFIIREESGAPGHTYIIYDDTSLHAPSCSSGCIVHLYIYAIIWTRRRSILHSDFRINFTCVILWTNHRGCGGSPHVSIYTTASVSRTDPTAAATEQLLHIINRRCQGVCRT